MASIDFEIEAVQRRFAEEQSRLKQGWLNERERRRIIIRDDLRFDRAGFEPHYRTCPVCIKAILTLAGPDAACSEGKRRFPCQ